VGPGVCPERSDRSACAVGRRQVREIGIVFTIIVARWGDGCDFGGRRDDAPNARPRVERTFHQAPLQVRNFLSNLTTAGTYCT
jgi:hypothetical protein